MAPEQNHEGEGEGTGLRRSEIRTLRKYVDLWPIDEEERRDTVQQMVNIVRHPKTKRYLKIGAAKTLVAMSKVNIDERRAELPPPPPVQNNTQINVSLNGLTDDQLAAMRTASGLLQGSPIPTDESAGDRVAGEPDQPPGDRD